MNGTESKCVIYNEFSKFELPYPMSEWAKGLAELYKSGGKITLYSEGRRSNTWYCYLAKEAGKIVEEEVKK